MLPPGVTSHRNLPRRVDDAERLEVLAAPSSRLAVTGMARIALISLHSALRCWSAQPYRTRSKHAGMAGAAVEQKQ